MKYGPGRVIKVYAQVPSAYVTLNVVVFPLREANVGLSYFSGYFGIERHTVDMQSVEVMSMSEDPVSTASLKLMFPAAIVA